jgi:thiamine biosynthesis lipoprotein
LFREAMTKPFLLISLCFSAFALLSAEPPRLSRFTFAEVHMGTRFGIVLYAPDETTARRAVKAAFARAAELDQIMSDYKATSELMRLCQKAGGEPVPVSADLFAVLLRAESLSRRSKGAFDVTVGPLVRLWRTARRTKRLPDPAELARALKSVGWQNVRLDPERRTVQLLILGMLLDLGGIAKGYAAEEMLAILRRHGLTRALVSAGGDIVAGEAPPDAPGWKVGIAPLCDPDAEPEQHVLLHHAAVSTSGDSRQHVEIDGKRYSHTIDPKTGMALTGRRSVTVVVQGGMSADGLTTAVGVLGPEAGLAFIEATDGAAALYVREGKSGVESFASKRFERFLFKGKVPAKGP